MKKRPAKGVAAHWRQQHLQKETTRSWRKRNRAPRPNTIIWDPDTFCSDSDSSVISNDEDKSLSTPACAVIDLIGRSDHDTEPPEDVSSAQSSEEVVVLLSAGEKGKVQLSKPEKLTRRSVARISVDKISLGLGSKADDTLETLRPKKATSSGPKAISKSHCISRSVSHDSLDVQLDDTSSGDSVKSGPSSPHRALVSLRCRECNRLFTNMRRQGPLKNRKRDSDPSSLSCDTWVLKKTWHPQRRRQTKGKLWVHLKRIRKLAVEHSVSGVANTTWAHCSRPHVFLQRNLRRCREMSSMLGCTSITSAKLNRRRSRSKDAWPPLCAKYQKKPKKKSLGSSTSQQFSAMDLALSTHTAENMLPAGNNADPTRYEHQENVFKDVSGFQDKQGGSDALHGTRRVLKFEDSLSGWPVETQKPVQSKAHVRTARTLQEGQRDRKDRHRSRAEKVLCVEEHGTSPDHSGLEPVVRKYRPSHFYSEHFPRGAQKCSFRSVLAAFEKSHNRIIKESYK
ncbi:uncharacterized protein si:ch211-227n13.3 isoform X2 [Hoplias malabaricus]